MKKKPAVSDSLRGRKVMEVKAGVFKDTCLQLLDRVHHHDVELVVTKRGTEVARVVPPDEKLPSAFGYMRGTIVERGDIVSPDFEAWGELG
jgi:antitoxin (DNA-binding transcriptional repressor) of toxin-antitoxin stability system